MPEDPIDESQKINTGGGSFIRGSVETGGGDFVGRDKYIINIAYQQEPFVLRNLDLAKLRTKYLKYIQESYQYLDFKGTGLIEAIEKASGLSLEDVYVPLKARPSLPEGETWHQIAGRIWHGDEVNFDSEGSHADQVSRSVLVDEIMNNVPGLVLLGDPGSGKSTLLKVLALDLSRQEEGPLPILVPLSAYADVLKKDDLSLHDFLSEYFASRQGSLRGIAPLFEIALEQHQAVVMLDGLDEIQEQHEYLARLVEDFVREHIPAPDPDENESMPPGNRIIITSRFVGYRGAPLRDSRLRTYVLVDWERNEIEQFVHRWTSAVEMAITGGKMNEDTRRSADQEKTELLKAIFGSPGIERLAGNPLLLTILALVKRQGVMLPHRRVELYEIFLRILLSTWNKARALDKRPIGPQIDYLEAVQILAPLALWLRETNPSAGFINERQLLDYLIEYFQSEEGLTKADSRHSAREFLDAVHRYSNLLLERGKNKYGLIHLTLEEYLAGVGITLLDSDQALDRILSHLVDPIWHETLLLGIEALGVVNRQPVLAGGLLESLLEARLHESEKGANTLLAGEVLLDIDRVGVGKRVANRITTSLIQDMQDIHISRHHRKRAGWLLGELNWLPEDLDELVEVPRGDFLYGDTNEMLFISYPYWIAKYPITNFQYARFLADNGYDQRAFWSYEGWERIQKDGRKRPAYWDRADLRTPTFPVVGITWYEAEAYCNWLKYQGIAGDIPDNYTVRLPTEEEWERAARGTDGRVYPWGNEFQAANANVATGGVIGMTAVCTYPQGASPIGAWDMSGNVWEWTYSMYYENRKVRVLRGGSWVDRSSDARCAYSGAYRPDFFLDLIGFRVAVSPADPGSGIPISANS
jgi:formylglycine-generating enzyme required for sulfatase activity/energy-coupling factor transporter ATP-binding protein EcfA2